MSTWSPTDRGVLRLPSGRLIRGRAAGRSAIDVPPADFGLYLLTPTPAVTWPFVEIDWPDFGLPTDPTRLRAALVDALARTPDERVEIACHGGRGRTGTALACLAILDGIDPSEAVRYVRRGYRRFAVETPGQRRFVHQFR